MGARARNDCELVRLTLSSGLNIEWGVFLANNDTYALAHANDYHYLFPWITPGESSHLLPFVSDPESDSDEDDNSDVENVSVHCMF